MRVNSIDRFQTVSTIKTESRLLFIEQKKIKVNARTQLHTFNTTVRCSASADMRCMWLFIMTFVCSYVLNRMPRVWSMRAHVRCIGTGCNLWPIQTKHTCTVGYYNTNRWDHECTIQRSINILFGNKFYDQRATLQRSQMEMNYSKELHPCSVRIQILFWMRTTSNTCLFYFLPRKPEILEPALLPFMRCFYIVCVLYFVRAKVHHKYCVGTDNVSTGKHQRLDALQYNVSA